MKLTNITHIFFDLDHTLWDFDLNSELAFREIFKEQNLDLDVESFLEAYKPINLKYWGLYRNNSVSKEALRFGRLKESFDSLEFEATDATINRLADLYIQYLPNNNHLLEGSSEILRQLKKQYSLHIITNGFEEVQHRKMISSGISGFFKTVTTSEEAGVKKPDPGIFELALQKSGALAKNSVMIGDNLEADILGAENYGIRAIHLNPGDQLAQAQFVQVKKLKELLNYL